MSYRTIPAYACVAWSRGEAAVYGIGGTRIEAEEDARMNGLDLPDEGTYHHPSEGDLENIRTHGGVITIEATPALIDAVEARGGDVALRVEAGLADTWPGEEA